MKLYHASQLKFDVIKRNQVNVPDDLSVPESELQNKIYMTPHLGFALAMAAGPTGVTKTENGTVSFENEAEFDPEKIIYVYVVDSDSISNELIEKIDDNQYAIDMDELVPILVQESQAKEVLNYYTLVKWEDL